MDSTDGTLGVGLVHQNGDLDLGGGDDVDVDVGVLFDELSEINQDQIMKSIDEAYLKFDSYIDDNFRE